MGRLDWGTTFREYESGIDRGVLYFGQREFVAWNGLVSVEERVIGIEPKPLYFDGIVYNLRQGEPDFTAGIEAFTYPYLLEEHVLAMCDTRINVGARSDIEPFNFTYRVMNNNGYKIHLVYNVVATFEGYIYETINASNSLSPFTFTFHATPVVIPNAKPTAHFVVNTAKANASTVENLENILYGSDTSTPKFPTAEELVDIFTPFNE